MVEQENPHLIRKNASNADPFQHVDVYCLHMRCNPISWSVLVRSCGMDAITSDELGRAEIDYDKCVSCGMCLVNCPFGAIVDKGQIFQTIHAMKSGKEVIAAIAPAFVGQFGPNCHTGKGKGSIKGRGFADVVEVAIGADLCTVEEAEDFLSKGTG